MPDSSVDLESVRPPKWPLKILRFFVRKQYLEEIEGDMEEVFSDNLSRLSVRKARRLYALEALKLLRPILLKDFAGIQIHSQQAMYANYFKISLRGLMKNPLNSFINVFGLSAAIGICIFAYAFARWTYSTDQFHKYKNEVYLVTFHADRDGTSQQYGTTPAPLGEMLRQDIPQISKVCRVEDGNVVVKHKADVFHERIRYVDPEFLEMFTFPMKWGTAASLSDVNSVIISEDVSIKYFGDANPVGLPILIKFDKDRSKEFKITGVAAEFPKARSITFNFLINFDNLRTGKPAFDLQDWKAVVNATLIQVSNPADTLLIQRAMAKYRAIQNKAAKEEWAITSFSFLPLATLHEQSDNIRDDISRSSSSNYKTIAYLLGISLLLLALACFNYINIAISTAAKRLKEIGVRKSIGANRKVVIVQFLTENMVITSFAMLIGLLLAAAFFIPAFEYMWSFSMDFKLTDGTLWLFLPAIMLFTTIASGIYPSVYISRFQVAGILRGSVKFGKKNPVTKVFLTLQLIICCIFITTSVMFTQNSLFMAKRPWGYDQFGAIYAVVPDQQSYDQLSTEMLGVRNVIAMSGSRHHLGKTHEPTVIHFPDREYEVDQLAVSPTYFETMGLQLREGRVFNDHKGSDRQAVVINELLAENMKWGQPVGERFRIDSTQYEVVGVLKDFHSYNFGRAQRPVIFKVAAEEEYQYLSIRVTEGTGIESYKALQDKWAQLFPEMPFEGGLQEDVWGFYFEEIKIHGRVWKTIAFLAVSLAALGLYGLISLNVEGRVREFSIRKVLGANLKNLTGNVMSQYVILFSVALIVGAPAGHILGSRLIHAAYAYHIPVDYTAVVLSTVTIIAVLLFTVATQVRRVLTSNPVDGLKIE